MVPLRRFLAFALFLAACAGVAWLLEARAAAEVRRGGEAAQEEALAQALEGMADRLSELEGELLRRAEALAAHPRLREALRDPAAAHDAVEVFRALRLPEGYAAELYTPLPRLVAWQGPSLPFDPATRRTSFLTGPQSAVVVDGPYREAVVAWVPVVEEGRVLGAVRVVRLVRVRVPVRNQYLQDEDLLERWAQHRSAPMRAVPLEVRFAAPPDAASGLHVRTVHSVDGPPLAHIVALPPPLDRLERAARTPYRDAQVFFLLLLMGWGLWGFARFADHRLREAVRHPSAAAAALAALLLLALAAAWWGARYALLGLGVPARFVASGPATPPAFDPSYLGSGFGGGAAGSVAELAITAVWAFGFGAAALYVGLLLLRARKALTRVHGEGKTGLPWTAGVVAASAGTVLLLATAATLVHRATVDATLSYFDQTGLLPGGLVLLAFGAFLLTVLAAGMGMVALALAVGVRGGGRVPRAAAAVGVALALAYAASPLGGVLPWPVALAAVALVAGAVAWLERDSSAWAVLLSMRGALGLALVGAALAYPIVYGALHEREEARVRDAAEDFADGDDARVAFALESVLLDARASEEVHDALTQAAAGRALPAGLADSLAADLVLGSLLAALADYHVALVLRTAGGVPLGQYVDEPTARVERVAHWRLERRVRDPLAFQRLRRLYEEEAGAVGFAVEREPAGERGGRYRYAGVGPVRGEDPRRAVLGWISARAEPKPARYVAETPFPRVLVPAGLYRLAEDEWAFAQFEGGVLLRARGGDLGRFRLPAAAERLAPGEAVWNHETAEGNPVRVYYRRLSEQTTVAVRVPAPSPFDHLYNLLRLLLPGLVLAAAAFAGGVALRRLGGPAPLRTRLRDRVLNRFLLVGLLSVAATGLIGRSVIVTQNREAVEERLRQRLARVEAALVEEAAASPVEDGADPAAIPPERLLDRARPDVVASRLGLDLNVYQGGELMASSRSQLVRQRLIEQRLPIEVVHALFVEGRRYAFATEHIGRFRYTTGFEALPDAEGRPAVVLAVPTLPEQIAIEADQARMVAYLFGVLLLLLGVIFAVATVLANRLTRPFRRLREGLRAVGAGEAPAEPIPVESRDEVGEVIETFNAVWDQLEESRRRLAAQERELAWREMAQQVAHEIKNPLTPMKLSVQHLRRAYDRSGGAAGGDGEDDGRFGQLLDRITGTLVEQIDALSRIASEFSRFARLPEGQLEPVDLAQVMRQAAALVSEEPRAALVLALPEDPLPVLADREELRRVFINLLKNAQQAIPEGERGTVTVRAERRQEGGRAWAWGGVIDTGAGIPEDVQPRVFQPRFSTKTSGMGLGLAIARKAVEDLGGEIGFETQPGLGTTFFVRLPLAEGEGGGEAEAHGGTAVRRGGG